MRLQNRIVSGLGWTSLASFGSQGLRLLFKLVLAKLLLPEDYGIIGMAAVFIGFIEVVSEMGMVSALIQRPKEKLYPQHYATAFWLNVAIALLGYVLIVLVVSPLAVWFYEEPILGEVMPLLALPFIFNTFYAIPKAKLSKSLKFKPQAIAEVMSVLVGGIVATILAFRGWGVWALAWNGVMVSLVAASIYWLYVRWLPQLAFSRQAFHELFGFGSKVMIERIFHFFTLNVDYLLIGKLIGGAALGAYTLGFVLTNTLVKQLTNVLNKVMFPAYSSIQKSKDAIAKYFLHTSKMSQLIVFPMMLGLVVLAKPIIQVGFGTQWMIAVTPLQILALATILNGLSANATVIMRSVGRSDLSMKLSISSTLLSTIPGVTVGALLFGINGAAAGILIDRVFRFFWYQRTVHRLIGVHYLALLKMAFRPFLACLLIGGLAKLLYHLHPVSAWPHLLIGGTFISTGYLWYLLSFERELLDKVLVVTKIQDKVVAPVIKYINS
ncbi:lipopolysaccharide biosynthesis protein [Tunicatimonas pelagia]|uniref:lipopolysaccharide biosynthesis protein n=1 Tax=Tunicatimonas pelagia TaxID=931531 RepID=UPI0026669F28|nr:lipopolysaccharide biosynthesis protein [Tunicatimonas pelagia]WKN40860.1 lipopolysaccharide biosynthesis protein [Tunicatimonas pelagia]